MTRPLLLDLCAGAGGSAVGYNRAGFNVLGVDLVDQPRFPFPFVEGDALEVMGRLLDGGTVGGHHLGEFSAITTSPPCQRFSQATLSQRRAGRVYPDLLTPLRRMLNASGLPWVIENVPGAPLRPDFKLCGCMFGLELPGVGQLRRERWFETSWHAVAPPVPHRHRGPAISIAGHGTPAWMRARTGHVGVAAWRQVMGVRLDDTRGTNRGRATRLHRARRGPAASALDHQARPATSDPAGCCCIRPGLIHPSLNARKGSP